MNACLHAFIEQNCICVPGSELEKLEIKLERDTFCPWRENWQTMEKEKLLRNDPTAVSLSVMGKAPWFVSRSQGRLHGGGGPELSPGWPVDSFWQVGMGRGSWQRERPRSMRWRSMSPIQETQVWSWIWEDLLEKEMATHSSVLAESGASQSSIQETESEWYLY